MSEYCHSNLPSYAYLSTAVQSVDRFTQKYPYELQTPRIPLTANKNCL